MAKKFKNYCFTLNNYTEDDYKKIQDIECRYMIFGKEIAPKTGTPHLQGYICFENARSFNVICKMISKWHIEPCRGSVQQNIDYCRKEGKYWEKGDPPSQGMRSDLIFYKNAIQKGMKVENILISEPDKYHQYGRTLNKLEDITMRKKWRTEMTKGIWYYGETGVGKSHKAFENYTPETHYVLPNDNGWWDAYTQQDTVIINDFRGEIPYNFLLQIVDKWPLCVKRRNREPMPFISKTVIITSSLPPELIYKNRNEEDRIEQLLRRFDIIKIGNGNDVVMGNTNSMTDTN